MSDMCEIFSALKKVRQEKRADNREQSAEYLAQRGIPFVEKNGGAHLIVEGNECFIDFWPGTGKWIARNGNKGFGVRNLVDFIVPTNARSEARPDCGPSRSTEELGQQLKGR